MPMPFHLLFLSIIHTVKAYNLSFFAIRRGLSSCILLRVVLCKMFSFRGMVRNGIPRVCFYFYSTERNSKLFSLPRKGLERNFESLLLFCSTERVRAVLSSEEGFGIEFREVSVPRNNRNSLGNNHLFRLIPSSAELFFCRKFPTLSVPILKRKSRRGVSRHKVLQIKH
jgi:hypothetical protein